jgi:hypothetical protein
VKASGVRYSYTGAITEPRQVLRGGYLSWEDPASGSWWQETWFEGNEPTFRNLGPIDQKANGNVRAVIRAGELREQIDRLLRRGPKESQPDLDTSEIGGKKDAVTPRDFIQKRMRELDKKCRSSD